ncbi:ADP-heptose:LPS heptosyltransferase [Granulicella pectinivorans]|uniref:ADP-heptose:LPS heptosyltransferase n=1 Tax=Granulicella pectinivorans TaxID=474950 RepID=A0A1I6MLM5_9BACT|nr:glycosyltransferase family 9 protein [Granulicella pectinivorans]SFS16600.1 ADP-heptose:LPS heptosyltransferase [Granulicella pectinivorans]
MGVAGAVKSVGLSAVAAVERVLRGTRMKPDPAAARNVLVLEYRLPLGCCVHQTPFYEAMKLRRPDVSITVATRGLGADFLRHHPFVDHVISTSSDGLKDPRAAAREVRAQLAAKQIRPDCILTGFWDSRTVMAVMAMLTAPVWRGGYTLAPELFQKPLQRDRSLSQIGLALKLAKLMGAETSHLEPRVFFSAADQSAAQALLAAANPTGKPLVVMVTQGSGGQSTGWKDERNVQVIRYITETLGFALVFVGTPGDTARIETLREAAGGAGTSVAGKTTVTELAALLAMSDWVVSIDTGTMHVGRAVGVPMVVLGPSWQAPEEWMPLGFDHIKVMRGEDKPHDPPGPPGYQLDEIQADWVTTALDRLIQAYPASSEARASRIARGLSTVDHR